MWPVRRLCEDARIGAAVHGLSGSSEFQRQELFATWLHSFANCTHCNSFSTAFGRSASVATRAPSPPTTGTGGRGRRAGRCIRTARGQRMRHVLAGARDNSGPIKRARTDMVETDLHACELQELDHLCICGSLICLRPPAFPLRGRRFLLLAVSSRPDKRASCELSVP